MAIKPQQITSWSFSRYNVYRQCPQLAKFKFITKLKEPGSEAMERGSAIHTMAEDYIKGKVVRMPAELKLFADEMKKLKGEFKKKLNTMAVEDTWAFTKDWGETRWDDWTGCWLRIKLDLAHFEDDGDTVIVTDWKTGKFREEMHQDYMEQLELYALGALLKYPHVKTVKPRLCYLDLGITYPKDPAEFTFTRADEPKLLKLWAKRIKPMLADTRFAPRANDKCRFCHFSASKGGQCKY